MKELLFFRPRSIKEALNLLESYKSECRIIAGGTDLMPFIRTYGTKGITAIMDITSIPDLTTYTKEPTKFRIGAGITHSVISSDPLFKEYTEVLYMASGQVGSPQIRNRGTIGGNIITAAACADTLPALLVLDAMLVFTSLDGIRTISLADYLSKKEHSFFPDRDILSEVVISIPEEPLLSYFYKLIRRNAAGKSRISIARVLKTSKNKITYIKLAVGAMTEYPVRCCKAEDFLLGKELNSDTISEAADTAFKEIKTFSGERKSSSYKFPVFRELFKRSLEDHFLKT